MSNKAEIDAAYVLAAARAVGLDLAPAHLPGVIANFQHISEIAALVNEFALADDVESAAVFAPCSPRTE